MNRGSYDVQFGNLFPGSGRATTGLMASATSRFNPRGTTATTPDQVAPDTTANDEVSQAAAIGKKGNPLVALFIAALVIGLFIWGSHKLLGGESGDIRLSFHNVLAIAGVTFVSGPLAKILFTKIKVPGATTVAYM